MRLVDDADRDELAQLLLDAYRGTIDDEGETAEDALSAVDHYLAIVDRMTSVVVTDAELRIVAMSFVVVVYGRHYIDPAATAAAYKRQGVGTAAVLASLHRLEGHGIDEVGAVITDGNVASERLFAALGFERVGEWPRPPVDLASSPAP